MLFDLKSLQNNGIIYSSCNHFRCAIGRTKILPNVVDRIKGNRSLLHTEIQQTAHKYMAIDLIFMNPLKLDVMPPYILPDILVLGKIPSTLGSRGLLRSHPSHITRLLCFLYFQRAHLNLKVNKNFAEQNFFFFLKKALLWK